MRTILIVDDEPLVRNLLVCYIALQGYCALEAVGRAEALELVRSHPEPIHLAIIDQTLEDGNGLDLARELSTIQPGMHVLMISGWTEETALAGLPEAIAVGFLQKPFNRKVLLDRIGQILGRKGIMGAGNHN